MGNVLIGMTTTSKVTGLSNDYVKVYKYDLEDEEYELISSNNSNLLSFFAKIFCCILL